MPSFGGAGISLSNSPKYPSPMPKSMDGIEPLLRAERIRGDTGRRTSGRLIAFLVRRVGSAGSSQDYRSQWPTDGLARASGRAVLAALAAARLLLSRVEKRVASLLDSVGGYSWYAFDCRRANSP